MCYQALKYPSILLLAFFSYSGFALAIGEHWQPATPFARTAVLDGLAWDGARFWTVGAAGTLAVSTDGRQWQRQESATDSHLYAISWNNQGRHVAVGEAGAVVSDGVGAATVWTPLQAQSSADLLAIASDGQGFVSVGAEGTILYSDDGYLWQKQSVPSSMASLIFRTVAWHAGLWLVAGDNGMILSSNDGQIWQSVTNNNGSDIHALSWWPSASVWLAAGSGGTVLTSVDGQQWQAFSAATTVTLKAISLLATEAFVGGDRGVISKSVDGQSWNLLPAPQATDIKALATNTSRLLAVGDDALSSYSDDQGGHWQSSRPNRQMLYDVAANPAGQWVAVGAAGALLSSHDAQQWQSRPTPSGRTHSGLTWDGSSFWAVGDAGEVMHSNSDGSSWALVIPQACLRTMPAGRWSSATAQDLQAITFAAGRYVAVGAGGAIIDSTDGISWCAQTVANAQLGAPAPSLTGIASDGQSFVAVGDQGNLLVSSDGINWTSRNSLTTAPLRSVLWDGVRWNIVGEGVLLTSVDSVHWQLERSLQLASGNGLARLNSHSKGPAGLLVAAGYLGVVATSNNGLDWSVQKTGFGDLTLQGVASSATAIVAVGAGGMILGSSDEANLAVSAQLAGDALQGQSTDLLVSIHNNGLLTATEVAVALELPSGLTNGGAITGSAGSCTALISVISCQLGLLPSQGRVDLVVTLIPQQAGTRNVIIKTSGRARETQLDDNVAIIPVVVSANLPGSVSAGNRLSGAGMTMPLSLLAFLLLLFWRYHTAQNSLITRTSG